MKWHFIGAGILHIQLKGICDAWQQSLAIRICRPINASSICETTIVLIAITMEHRQRVQRYKYWDTTRIRPMLALQISCPNVACGRYVLQLQMEQRSHRSHRRAQKIPQFPSIWRSVAPCISLGHAELRMPVWWVAPLPCCRCCRCFHAAKRPTGHCRFELLPEVVAALFSLRPRELRAIINI